jgi:hypothetical protein
MLETPPEICSVGQLGPDARGGGDEIVGVVVVLFDAGGHREDIGIEDDVFRREADLVPVRMS